MDTIESTQRKLLVCADSVVVDKTTIHKMKPVLNHREKIFNKNGKWVDTKPMKYEPVDDKTIDLSKPQESKEYIYNSTLKEKVQKIDVNTNIKYIKSNLIDLTYDCDRNQYKVIKTFIYNALRKYKSNELITWKLNVEGYYRLQSISKKAKPYDIKSLTCINVNTKDQIIKMSVNAIFNAQDRDEYYWDTMFNNPSRLILAIFDV